MKAFPMRDSKKARQESTISCLALCLSPNISACGASQNQDQTTAQDSICCKQEELTCQNAASVSLKNRQDIIAGNFLVSTQCSDYSEQYLDSAAWIIS